MKWSFYETLTHFSFRYPNRSVYCLVLRTPTNVSDTMTRKKKIGFSKRIICFYCKKLIKVKDLGGVVFHNPTGEKWFHNRLPCLIQFQEEYPKK